MIYYTSDLHLGHEKLVSVRGYSSLQEMNDDIVAKYNSVVGPNDSCYILGDVHLGKHNEVKPYFDQLNGYKTVILGNHCPTATKLMELGIHLATKELHIEDMGWKLWLNHFPIDNSADARGYKRPAPRIDYDVALCGHVHTLFKHQVVDGKPCINVGVDVWDMRPINIHQIVNHCAHNLLPIAAHK